MAIRARAQPASGRPRCGGERAGRAADGARCARRRLRRLHEPRRASITCSVRNRSPEAVGEAQQRMWELALHLEEGQTERTARALDEARQAARDALDKAIREPNDANREALDRRLKELEEAIAAPPAGAGGRGAAQQRRDAVRPECPAPDQPRPGPDGGAGARGRARGPDGRGAAAHGGAGAHAGPAAQRARRARARWRARRGAAPARPPADGRGAGHDRPAGGLLDHSQGRVDETTRFRGNRPPTAAGRTKRRNARRTGGCSRRCAARSAS